MEVDRESAAEFSESTSVDARRSVTHLLARRRIALILLTVLTGVVEVGALHVARDDFVVVPTRNVVLTSAATGLLGWALCLFLGMGALVVLVRQRPRAGRSRLLAAGAGLWALISLVSGGLLLGAVAIDGMDALLNDQATEVRRSPSAACTVVLAETATFDQATELLYVVGPLGIGSPTDGATVEHGRPLREGRVVVAWRTDGGSVSYGSEQGFDVSELHFQC